MPEETITTEEVLAQVPKADTESKLPSPEERITITEENKEDFFKAFLSDQCFEEVVPMLHGKSKAKFRTLAVNENDLVFTQIAFDQASGLAKNTDAYMVRVMQYRLAGSLLSIDDVPFCEDITPESHPANKETYTTYLSERVKVLQKKQVFKLAAINDAFNRFEAKVAKLTEETFKGNF